MQRRSSRQNSFAKSKSRRLRQPSLYSRTEEIRGGRSFRWVYTTVFFAAIFGVLYLIFFSPVLAVKKVNFSSTKYIDRGELDRALDGGRTFTDNNILTFGFFGLQSRLGKVTGVDSVTIDRSLGGTVNIKVEEKTPLFVWQYLDKKVLVDDDGIAWASYEDKYASLPVIVDTKNVPVTLGSKILPRSFTTFFKDLNDGFEKTTGVKAAKFEVLDIVSDLKVTSSAGWYAYFDTTRTARNELINLSRVLQDAKNKNKKLEYIDLRIDNRIFYK